VSRRTLIFIAILALVVSIAIGRYALPPTPASGIHAGTTGAQDDAAKAASRAMTFTQPKAPAQ
jgi:hypothetical protein